MIGHEMADAGLETRPHLPWRHPDLQIVHIHLLERGLSR
jgi:hypothetical protein